ncbi:hypothetical protein IE53DRAFT_342187 [Violaceomyces palustris]|uniref:Uncharacterized protein n=1 Tax=Violaceomyces palustris TaxID=1673888 RepID=A0ACD0P0K4_9BASI|nr:hypothetical protein IE53DRAFT_342187 [Violaceomyces palustris]
MLRPFRQLSDTASRSGLSNFRHGHSFLPPSVILAGRPSLGFHSTFRNFNAFTSTRPSLYPNETNTTNPPPSDGKHHAAVPTLEETKEEAETSRDPTLKHGFLYFDSVFPIRLGFWDIRYLVANFEKESLVTKVEKTLPSTEKIGHDFKVLSAQERIKDGGAFVHFSYRRPLTEERDEALASIEGNLKEGVKKAPNTGLFLFWGRPSVHVVRGKPFREDMSLYPCSRIRVKLEGGDASVEELWSVLRPYGRILNIEKEKAGEALVNFSRTRGATSARNCAYGYILPSGARLVLNYESARRGKMFWDWLTSHPRIVFPVLAFLIGGISYAVFDPIRAFFVESKIENTFSLEEYKIYSWLKAKTVDLFRESGAKNKEQDDWWERREAAENIQGWICERPTTFITISGPRGSGKEQLIQKIVSRDLQHLIIDCDNISKVAKNDGALVSALAAETGYYPVFGWLNSLNSMIDLAAVGLIGSKAGFATPIDAQLKQVLGVVSGALAHLGEKTHARLEKEKSKKAAKEKAARTREKTTEDAELGSDTNVGHEKSLKSVQGLEKMEGELLIHAIPGMDPTKKSDGKDVAEKLQVATSTVHHPHSQDELGPEKGLRKEGAAKVYEAPVVIIKHFHHKGIKQTQLHTALAEWAAELVTNGIAHVIFVSDNPVAMSKELTKALPNAPFESIVLADADEEKARAYVFNKLKELGKLDLIGSPSTRVLPHSSSPALYSTTNTEDSTQMPQRLDVETAKWVDKLGGRLTDLENLVQKVAVGQTVESAVQDIIARTVIELRKNAFGEDASEASSLPWPRDHAWVVVKSLAESEEVNYYGLLHDSFKGNEASLKALEQAEIVSVRHVDGRPSVIRAGRPVLQQAIERLVSDRVFSDTQNLLSNASTISSCEKSIRAIEEEIKDLGEVSSAQKGLGLSSGSGVMGVGGSSGKGKGTEATRARVEFLLKKMETFQEKIDKLDRENSEIKRRLKEEKDEF